MAGQEGDKRQQTATKMTLELVKLHLSISPPMPPPQKKSYQPALV